MCAVSYKHLAVYKRQDGNYSKDENQWNEKVKEYVANLAAAIDTDGKDHTFPEMCIRDRTCC